MKVQEIMCTEVIDVGPRATLKEAAAKMKEFDVGALPVLAGNSEILGIITDRDITCRGVAEGCNSDQTLVDEIMSKGVITCFDDDDAEEAIETMETQEIRRLPVISHNNGLVGILALGDISESENHELSGELLEAVSHHHAGYH